MRWLGALLCMAIGAVLGALGMRAYLAQPPASAAPAASFETRERAPATLAMINAPAVWATLESGVDARRVPAVVLREPAVVLLRFADFIPAERGYWIDAAGKRHALDRAVAVHLELGLLAFAHAGGGAPALDLAADNGSLFLGLDVEVHTPDGARRAFIDSAAIEYAQNDYRYALGGFVTLDAPMGAVVNSKDNTLAGVALAGDDNRWLAMDAGTLRAFLDDPLTPPIPTLAQTSDYVFRQPLGMARRFDSLVRTGRWIRALETARELSDAAPALLTDARIARVHDALERQLRGLLAAQRLDDAAELVRSDVAMFGASVTVLQQMFEIASRRLGVSSAVTLFSQGDDAVFNQVDDALRLDVLRLALLQWLASPQSNDADALSMLDEALRFDADYAPYHRALGLRLFELGDYARAAFHLQRASTLDPAMAAELARALRTARQRRQVSNAVEVPLQGSGSALYVPVQLNGGATFRFLLDTGASYSAINTATLLRLGYSGIFNRGAPVIELETANGRVFAQTFTMPSMAVGDAVVEQVPVVILEDMGPLDGLLGLSFLQHFDVQIDSRNGVLVLEPR